MKKKKLICCCIGISPLGQLHSGYTKFGIEKMFRYFLYLLPLLLKITLFITCCIIHFQRRWTRCYRTQKGFMLPGMKAVFSLRLNIKIYP